MCESTVYLKTKDEMKKIMENVVIITPEQNGVFIEDILGEQQTIEGKITQIKLLDHMILIEA